MHNIILLNMSKSRYLTVLQQTLRGKVKKCRIRFRRKVVMKNIQTILRPLSIVLCLCGFEVFEYPEGRPRLCLTILYILLSWLFYTYLIIKALAFMDKFEIDIFSITIINIGFSIAYILLSLFYHKKFKSCLNKLNIVTDTLEKLGTPTSYYTKLYMCIKRLIIGWIILSFFLNMLDSLWVIEHNPLFKSYAITIMYQLFILNHTFYVNMLYDLTFMILLRYIEFHFEQINQHIQKLTEKKKRVKRTSMTSSSLFICRHTDTETPEQIIWILMHVHLELSSISRELNQVFGFQTVIQTTMLQIYALQFATGICKAIMVISTYSMYLMAIEILISLIWAIIHIIKMIIFNYICERICTEANRTELFLNKLTNLNIDVETQSNITQFLLQLLQRPLKISGLGFYFYGYSFIQWFVGNIAKIVIFVIQTQQVPEKY